MPRKTESDPTPEQVTPQAPDTAPADGTIEQRVAEAETAPHGTPEEVQSTGEFTHESAQPGGGIPPNPAVSGLRRPLNDGDQPPLADPAGTPPPPEE